MVTRFQIVVGVVLSAAVSLTARGAQTGEPPPAKRKAELRHLVRHDCGSCHGLRLEGGLGPALTPGALGGQPVELLQRVILDGRQGTAMPPWRPFMSAAEARWIAEQLKTGGFVDE